MLPTSDCADAVDALYAVFQEHRLHADTNACPCCHRPGQERVLHSKPLRDLAAEDLRLYAADAILVWGDADDYRYFLPRIFELMVTLEDPSTELDAPAIVFGKLRFGDWWTWPEREQNAIRRYFVALWNAVLRTDPDNCAFTDVEDWLCGIAQAENDLLPYLAAWESEESVETGRHLSILVTEHPFIQNGGHARDFWAERKEQFAQVRKWLLSDAVKGETKTHGC
jgi:hypothetical protein